jgi:hypothetical protein
VSAAIVEEVGAKTANAQERKDLLKIGDILKLCISFIEQKRA